MNKRIKSLWLKAMSSGKYFKVTINLKRPRTDGKIGHCCLGVLCDLYAKSKEGKAAGAHWGNNNLFYTKQHGKVGEGSFLPDVVMVWAGLNGADPMITRTRSASRVNDSCNGYAKVANAIKKNL